MGIRTYKMINLDKITNENDKKHNEKWPYIPDHPYRILKWFWIRKNKYIT